MSLKTHIIFQDIRLNWLLLELKTYYFEVWLVCPATLGASKK